MTQQVESEEPGGQRQFIRLEDGIDNKGGLTWKTPALQRFWRLQWINSYYLYSQRGQRKPSGLRTCYKVNSQFHPVPSGWITNINTESLKP